MTSARERPAGPGDVARVADRLAVETALGDLAPKARAAVVLRYYHDLDYATIASILGTSSSNVGAMLSRSLDRMRVTLDPPPTAVADEAVR